MNARRLLIAYTLLNAVLYSVLQPLWEGSTSLSILHMYSTWLTGRFARCTYGSPVKRSGSFHCDYADEPCGEAEFATS
jgi:hypothetical protein